jgi:hypothetical protein
MRRMSPQQNLFEPATSARSDLSLPHRLKAIELLKTLLTEATLRTVIESDTPAREGAGDDQDHA